MRTFPAGFLWGTASSSFQVEGGAAGTDWDDWEAQPGRIHDGSRRGDALGWWRPGGAEADLQRAAALAQNAHRLSLEWARLEPEPGRFDDAAFARYAAILDELARLQMKPLVTLNHFTLPRWAARAGGWLASGLAQRFAQFAQECGRRLGDKVFLFATLNEPGVLALMGYVLGQWPPGGGGTLAALRAMRGQLRGHTLARRALQRVCSVPVGIVLNTPAFAPADPTSLRDRLATFVQNGIFVEAALLALRGQLDWLGVNYYGRYDVRFDLRAPGLGRHVQEPSIRTPHGDWGQLDAGGLRDRLIALRSLNVPLYVTENGVLDATDALRGDALIAHVAGVHEAIAAGADVRGYFHWTLIDNFEWAEGWSAPFGLHARDRSPRGSAAIYQKICRANAVE